PATRSVKMSPTMKLGAVPLVNLRVQPSTTPGIGKAGGVGPPSTPISPPSSEYLNSAVPTSPEAVICTRIESKGGSTSPKLAVTLPVLDPLTTVSRKSWAGSLVQETPAADTTIVSMVFKGSE